MTMDQELTKEEMKDVIDAITIEWQWWLNEANHIIEEEGLLNQYMRKAKRYEAIKNKLEKIQKSKFE